MQVDRFYPDLTFVAVILDSNGAPIKVPGVWSFTPTQPLVFAYPIPTAETRVFVRVLHNGDGVLTATFGGLSAQANVRIHQIARLVQPLPGEFWLPVGASYRLTAAVADGGGRGMEAPYTITWTSSDATIASVSADGTVQAQAPGEAAISAQVDTTKVGRSFFVTAYPLAFHALVLSGRKTCALDQANSMFCWGDGGYLTGLDALTTRKQSTPANLRRSSGALEQLVGLAHGFDGDHECALTANGKAVCWGVNDVGQAGSGVVSSMVTHPVEVTNVTFTSLTVGTAHTCGLTVQGAAYCWGYNALGAVGAVSGACNSTAVLCTAVPVPVEGGRVYRSLSAGSSYTCGITADSAAYCWGNNVSGQLGNGTASGPSTPSPTPTPVTGGFKFIRLSAGAMHVCGVVSGGSIYCWGSNDDFRAGGAPPPEPNLTRYLVPTKVPTDRVFSDVSAGGGHTCALETDGSAWCWGRNDDGQLGSGATGSCIGPVGGNTCSGTPTPVDGGIRFVELRTGAGYTCGVSTDGVTYCWGVGSKLGTGRPESANHPVPVLGTTR